MLELIRHFRTRLPDWVQDWLDILIPGLQIVIIIVLAWLLHGLLRRLLRRVGRHYDLPPKLMMPLLAITRWIIMVAAVLLVLGRLGVSADVLWGAFTGFAAVGAVAFFAAWSVLSNLFCALLIALVQPFRLGDDIEVLDSAEKPGAKGRVIDVNLLYVTLQEPGGQAASPRLLQIPNALVFQRVLRRWPGGTPASAADQRSSAAIGEGAGSASPAGDA